MFVLGKIVCQRHIYMYLTLKKNHFIFCGPFRFNLSRTAISIKFSISLSEISANGPDTTVSLFRQGDSCQSYTGSFVVGQNRYENDFHWPFTTVDYQQRVYANIANQIHGFTIDYGHFIQIVVIIVFSRLDSYVGFCEDICVNLLCAISSSFNFSPGKLVQFCL